MSDRVAVFNLRTEPDILALIIPKWAEATFPTANEFSIVNHLEEELEELGTALSRAAAGSGSDDEVGEEIADMVILLMHLAAKRNRNIFADVEKKFAEVQKRAWENPGDPAARERGYWKHKQG